MNSTLKSYRRHAPCPFSILDAFGFQSAQRIFVTHGEDVGSLFACFKGCEWYLPTEDDPEGEYLHPYTGPLDQEAIVYRYVVNETRKEYLDRFHSRHLCTVDGVDILEDVTPALLGDTCRLERNGEEVLDGIWVGDAITPTNDAPGEGYIDITPEYTIWP